MKKSMRFALVFSGVVGGSALAALAAVGCSNDDTATETVDASGDTTPQPDGDTTDSHADDVQKKDAEPADAGADVPLIPGDAGPPDFLNYPHQVSVLFCQRLAQCCAGSSPAGFDVAKCTTHFDTNPLSSGVASTRLMAPYLDGGQVVFDPIKAKACFDGINGLTCGAISSAAWKQVEADCISGVLGTLDAGATGCRGSIECKSPAHCSGGADPDGGTCLPPGAVGDDCTSSNYFTSQGQCGYHYSGDPRYCSVPGRNYPKDAAASVCADVKPNGAPCHDGVECDSRFCVVPATNPVLKDAGAGECMGTLNSIVSAATCKAFAPVDGGPDAN
jgi:hypothetical protein